MALDPNGKTKQELNSLEADFQGKGGIIAIVVVIVIAIAGYFGYEHHEKTKMAEAPAISAPADTASAPDSSASMPVTGSTMTNDAAASDATK